MKKKTIGICGYGYVGKAMHNLFKNHYNVEIYDPAIKNSYPFEEVDVAFVCVPTPPDEDGFADTSYVEESVAWIKADLIIVKSTIPIGTTDWLTDKFRKNIVFSPEYCGESKYWTPYPFHTDVVETPFFTFGGHPDLTAQAIDLFLPVTGPTKRYLQATAEEAEMAKYMENSFYAMKIAFCNEVYSICKAKEVDWHSVRELWLADPRINPMHTAVFADNRGFSGKCLPKDLKEFTAMADTCGVNPILLNAIEQSNEQSKEE